MLVNKYWRKKESSFIKNYHNAVACILESDKLSPTSSLISCTHAAYLSMFGAINDSEKKRKGRAECIKNKDKRNSTDKINLPLLITITVKKIFLQHETFEVLSLKFSFDLNLF